MSGDRTAAESTDEGATPAAQDAATPLSRDGSAPVTTDAAAPPPADAAGPVAPDAADVRAPAVPRAWFDPRGWPWWVQTLAVYLAGRAFSAVALVVTAQAQVENYWTPAQPSYLQFTGLMWDASWYRQAAEQGYPDTLPVGEDGLVQQNVWAFFPLFPMLVRGLMVLTTGPWYVVAPLTALVLGAAAAVVIHRLVERGAPRAVAARPGLPLATVALVTAFPTAVVLQVAYTESLALLLVAAALLLLVERRYLAMSVVVIALGFTRAVALPMAAVIVVHAAVRWWRSRRGEDHLGARDVGGLAALAVAAGVSGVAWPLICGWVTGVPDGYLQTQESWRGLREVQPFGAWGYVSRFWFGEWAPWVLVAGFALVVAVLLVPAAWRLGNELHAWPAAYLLYIAAVIEPGSSLARFLVLAFPLGAVTAGVVTRPAAARRLWFTGVLVLMLALQLVWVWNMWRLTPPQGWPP
ncbi:hypothetical protein CTKZ_33020 [Cellulomonas algicola]|uniref:Integral membrane protein n=1 Tax=Cellulomonas algicola TaxID=2071633 RepID=A0A401V485_9CELL|nr:hypothetical protein [Cellulomonas algicola]GCD21740.1 hypothetical protein CTKZ_33020 [Cellulomonas algicola]